MSNRLASGLTTPANVRAFIASNSRNSVSLIKQHLYNTTMQLLEDPTATMNSMQLAVADILETDSLHQIDMFIYELRSHGIEDPSQLEDAYYGCYPDVQTFAEDLVNDCYSETLNNLPTWLEDAIDYELVWYQSLRHDFFEVSFDGEVYIFNRHF